MEITQQELKRLICFLSGRFPVSENWWKKNKEDVYKETQEWIDRNLKPSDNSRTIQSANCLKCGALLDELSVCTNPKCILYHNHAD